jgi:hypothetical protein
MSAGDPWDTAAERGDDLLQDLSEADGWDRTSVTVQVPQPRGSLRPDRVVVRVLTLLPPWGRVVAVVAALAALLAAARWGVSLW